MSVALFIVAEREVEGLDTFVNGKALAHVDDLDGIAESAGVRPLMEFFSAGPDDYLKVIGEEGEDGELHLPEGVEPLEEDWFAADEGLETVRGLLRHVAAHPDSVERTDDVLDDLRGFEGVLAGLARAGVRWHLAVDL